MPTIPAMTRTELSRFGQSTMTRVVIVAIALIPVVYAGLLIWANFDPTHRLDRVPAAVVNEDEPVTVTNPQDRSEQVVPLGRTVTGTLTSSDEASNFDWILTDADDASHGLEDGSYAAVLTIPRTFSADATSSSGDDPRTATLDFRTNDARLYLNGTVTQSVSRVIADSLNTELTSTYLDNVFVGFTTLHGTMSEAADGAQDLAGGADALADGTTGLADGSAELVVGLGDLATGATSLDDGVRQADAGASSLADGLSWLSGGSSDLATGAASLAAGSGALRGGADELAGGVDTLRSQTADLPGQAAQLDAGAAAISDALNGPDGALAGAGRLAAGLAALDEQVQAIPPVATAIDTAVRDVADQIAADGGWADQMRDVATRLAGAADELDAVADGIVGREQALAELVSQCLAAGATQEFCDELAVQVGAIDVDQVTQGLHDAATLLRGFAEQLTTAADDLVAGAQAVVTRADALAEQATALVDGVGQLSAGASALETGLGRIGNGAAELAGGTGALADAAPRLTAGIDALAAGSRTLATGVGALDDGAGDLTDGARALDQGAQSAAAGARTLASGTGQLVDGADRLSSGAGSAAAGGRQLADGAQQLESGSAELAEGAGTLSDGLADGVDQVPSYTDSERATLADVVSAPVVASLEREHAVPSYGYGLGPYFMAIALWVGAMAVYMIVRAIPARAVASTAPTWRIATAGLGTGFAIGVVQVLVLAFVLRYGVGLEPARPWGWLVFGFLVSAVFMAINQALVAMFGTKGRFVALVLIGLQLTSAGAIYPIQTAPELFQVLHNLLPMTHAVNGFRTLMAGGSYGLGGDVLALLLWFAAGLGATLLAARSQRSWTISRLHPELVI